MEAAPVPAPAQSVPNWLTYRAQTNTGDLALICGGQRWTFGELEQRVAALAARLAAQGVGRGTRVACLLRNGSGMVQLIHALMRLDAVLVPLNTRLAAHELSWQLADCAAALLVHDEPHAALAEELRAAGPGLARIDALTVPDGAQCAAPPAGPLDLGAVQCIIYTSGTTGRPKGALLTYGNHWWNAIGSALNLGTHTDDRWLAVLPLFHVGGQAIVLRGVIYGVPVVVRESFDPAAIDRAIEQERITIVSVVSAMLSRLLDARGERPYPSWLRCVLLGGGPAPPPLLERCAALGIPVVQTYGLTEAASQVATLAPADALRKLGSAGKPLLPTSLRIEVDGRAGVAGEVGEIVARGPTMTPGYLGRPEATALALRDGWLHTGDLGYLDAEGYLYVVDRRDDLIVSGGENVYPAEIEAVLLSHPAVQEAGVIAGADPRWGHVPVAVVALRPGAVVDEETLLTYCAARLARYKVPRSVLFRESLPRNAAGKLLRRDLREALGEL